MKRLLQRVFRQRSSGGPPLSYDDSKRLIASADPADRRRVAERTEIRPEILYFLASDADTKVRSLVAANEATPVQADLLLARDKDENVRCVLAHKIARLAPGLDRGAADRLQRLTYETLVALAQDQAANVRRIVAEVLKEADDVPGEIVRQLARDPVVDVAGPVLRFSPLLSDDDLLEIIQGTRSDAGRRFAAIARRAGLGAEVADAIAETGEEAAVAALLANPSAQIREDTLDALVDRSRSVPAWHPPLVQRPNLSSRLIRKLAGFVAAELLEVLLAGRDIDPATASLLMNRVRSQLDEPRDENGAPDPEAAALAEAQRLNGAGKLDADAVLAAAERGRLAGAVFLAVRAQVAPRAVLRVLDAHSAKGLVALAWQARFDMADAVRLQSRLLRLSGSAMLRPLPDGRYPLSEEAMRWQLEFFAAA